MKGDRGTPGVDIVQEKRAAREEVKAVEVKVTLRHVRRITVKSINDYIERRLAAEVVRRGRTAAQGDDPSSP